MNKKITVSMLCLWALSLTPPIAVAKDKPQKKVLHKCKKEDNPVVSLACNMYQEARGEGIEGQLSVGFVTLNRVVKSNRNEKIQDIIYKSKQFSWTTSSAIVNEERAWFIAMQNSKLLMGVYYLNSSLLSVIDPTKGSVNFHTAKTKPYWVPHFDKTRRIGNHIFYRQTPKVRVNIESTYKSNPLSKGIVSAVDRSPMWVKVLSKTLLVG